MASRTRVGVERRRRFTRQFVPHDAYRWFMKRMVLWTVISAAVMAGVLWLRDTQHLQELLDTGLVSGELRPMVRDYAAVRFRSELLVLGLFTVAVVLTSSILVSRIAGPIYRLATDLVALLQERREGGRIAFRQGDRAHDVAAAVNRLLEARLEGKDRPEESEDRRA